MTSAQQTSFPLTGAITSENENTFTRANIFGLYLTLAFVLLVQPFGSLVYTKPSSALGRSVFFFWRLNPLACALEVLLFIVALLYTFYMAIRTRRHSTDIQLSLGEHLRVTAAAVNLLRRHGRLPDHWRASANSHRVPALMAASLDRPSSPGIRTETLTLETAMSTANTENDLTAPLPPAFFAQLTDDPASITSSNARREHSIGIQLSHSRTDSLSLVEAGGDGGPEAELMRYADSRFSDTALGRNVLSHAEYVIDLISTLAVILVFMKLAAVTIPMQMSIPAWFMIASWAFLQILLLAIPRHEIANPDHIIRHAVEMEQILYHAVIWHPLSAIFLTLFGYFTWVVIFEFLFIFEADTSPQLMLVIAIFTAQTAGCSVSLGCLLPLGVLDYEENSDFSWLSCFSRRSRNACEQTQRHLHKIYSKSKDFILTFILFQIVAANLVSSFLDWLLGKSSYDCLLKEAPLAWKWTILVMITFPILMWIWLFLPAMSFTWTGTWAVWLQGISLFCNLVITICFFTWAMITYDDTNTYKPEWVEWLGRLGKWRRLFQGIV